MREIKFRAWDNINDCIVGVSDIRFSVDLIQVRLSGYKQYLCPPNIELMQFTGIRDKNGKDIYEGDVLKVGNKICIVQFSRHTGMSYWLHNVDESQNNGSMGMSYSQRNSYEIIGNIYEGWDEE